MELEISIKITRNKAWIHFKEGNQLGMTREKVKQVLLRCAEIVDPIRERENLRDLPVAGVVDIYEPINTPNNDR